MSSLSVILITLNEEKNLPRCLKSVAWADEIVVVDCGSTDRTAEIARELGANFVHRDWEGYGRQKNFALSLATKDFVLVIDADEEVSPGLAAEIREVLGRPDPKDGYSFPRKAMLLGRWIRHGNWYPDRRVRLFRRGTAEFTDREIHESLIFRFEPGRLRHELLHYSYESVHEYFRKFNRYTELAAGRMYREGRRANLFDLFVKPSWVFLQSYLFRLGFLDGLAGFAAAALSDMYVFVKYLKLKEIERKSRENPGKLENGH
jgi:glycosyltransferase involved in cell wall biosynthesis